jgi:hypothetical protein
MDELIYNLLMSFPIIAETTQVRNDEVDIRVLRRQHFDDVGLTRNIDEQGQAKCLCSFAQFPGWHRLVPVCLDPSKSPACHSMLDHLKYAPRISGCMDKNEADKPVGITRDNLGHLSVGLCIVAVEEGKHNRFVDSSRPGAPQIKVQWRVGVPGRGHQIAFAGVTVTVNDHDANLLVDLAPIASRNQIDVTIPLKKLGK